MKLSLRNIGKIESADIELNGITVLAGENNSGKSTVGKVLFAMVNSLYLNQEQVEAHRRASIAKTLGHLFRGFSFAFFPDSDEITLLNKVGTYKHNKPALIEILQSFSKDTAPDLVERAAVRIIKTLNQADVDISKNLIKTLVEQELGGQVQNLINSPHTNGEIHFTSNQTGISCIVADSSKYLIDFGRGTDLPAIHSHAIYLESPYVSLYSSLRDFHPSFDLLRYSTPRQRQLSAHIEDAAKATKNAASTLVDEQQFAQIIQKFTSANIGELKQNAGEYEYYDNATKLTYKINNVSTGIKTFVLLKTLILNGKLRFGDVLILDEPEVHLHPKWQLVFAELLVIIQQELGLRILISTHSTDFLEAIEVYSNKHGSKEKCKYYLAENKGPVSVISDYTHTLDKIYGKLLSVVQTLEDERFAYDN